MVVFEASYARAKDVAVARNAPTLSIPSTFAPRALFPDANSTGLSYDMTRLENVAIVPPYFMPIAIDERKALCDTIVTNPLSVKQAVDFDPGSIKISVDLQAADRVSRPCVLIGGWPVWYHWLLNFLPIIYTKFMLQHVMPGLDAAPVAVARGTYRGGFAECLSALGYSQDRVILIDDHRPTIFDDIFISSSFPNSLHFPDPIYFLANTMRSFFLGRVTRAERQSRRLYISRDNGAPFTRRVINHADVDAVFLKLGFEIVRMETMSLGEQIRLIDECDCIVGTHGSGLTNLIFANPGTKAMEIGGFPKSMFSDLAEIMHVPFRTLLVSGEFMDPKAPHAHWMDYTVNPDELESEILKMIER